MGLGFRTLSSLIRVPNPPARITTFIYVSHFQISYSFNNYSKTKRNIRECLRILTQCVKKRENLLEMHFLRLCPVDFEMSNIHNILNLQKAGNGKGHVMKKRSIVSALLIASILVGCGKAETEETTTTTAETTTAESNTYPRSYSRRRRVRGSFRGSGCLRLRGR